MAGLIRRNKTYYALYYVGGKQKRVCLHTESLQVAKEKVRQIETAQMKGEDIPLTTRTPIGEVLTAYVEYLRAVKREGSCNGISTISAKPSAKSVPRLPSRNRRSARRGKSSRLAS